MKYVLALQFQNLPNYLLGGIFIANLIALVALVSLRKDMKFVARGISVMLLLDYVVLMYCTTVLFREARPSEVRLELIPFWNYCDVFSGKFDFVFWEVILNVLLYVPIGYLLGCIFKKDSHKWVFVISVSLSVFTELMQLILHRGFCETNDVIHNTLGTMLGLMLCGLVSKLFVYSKKVVKAI